MFIHDMLDFAVLTMKKDNFTCRIEKFNINKAFDFVYEVFSQKLKAKSIKFDIECQGMEEAKDNDED